MLDLLTDVLEGALDVIAQDDPFPKGPEPLFLGCALHALADAIRSGLDEQ